MKQRGPGFESNLKAESSLKGANAIVASPKSPLLRLSSVTL
jgi:hypothetical protein